MPLPIIESRAVPSSTNFAGGSVAGKLRIGHSRLYRLKIGSSDTRSMCASMYASRVPTSRQ